MKDVPSAEEISNLSHSINETFMERCTQAQDGFLGNLCNEAMQLKTKLDFVISDASPDNILGDCNPKCCETDTDETGYTYCVSGDCCDKVCKENCESCSVEERKKCKKMADTDNPCSAFDTAQTSVECKKCCCTKKKEYNLCKFNKDDSECKC